LFQKYIEEVTRIEAVSISSKQILAILQFSSRM